MKAEREQRLTRLADANPRFEHDGSYLSFDCPIHPSGGDLFCRVAIPLKPARADGWDHNGEGMDALTVTPSIKRGGGPTDCEWHGFIRAGAFEHCGDSR